MMEKSSIAGPETVAILGPTASGKTEIALRLAREFGAVVLSLDSLAIYLEVDIASAKPTPEERGFVPHFGIDLLRVDEHFSAAIFAELYRVAHDFAIKHGRPLLIVGGTGFYLKALMDGLSVVPPLSLDDKARLQTVMTDLPAAYARLRKIDPSYADRIASTDRYRIEKGLAIHLQSGLAPTRYFELYPPQSIAPNLELFEIAVERASLAEAIDRRTRRMVEAGLFDEVAALERRYGRAPHPMKSIGIAETLDFFDGKFDTEKTIERIVTHTRRLAKRQTTFNKTQFPPHPRAPKEVVYKQIASRWENFRFPNDQ